MRFGGSRTDRAISAVASAQAKVVPTATAPQNDASDSVVEFFSSFSPAGATYSGFVELRRLKPARSPIPPHGAYRAHVLEPGWQCHLVACPSLPVGVWRSERDVAAGPASLNRNQASESNEKGNPQDPSPLWHSSTS